MKFLAYQKRWILDDSTIKLYEKTRRGGITYATSYRACRKCIKSGKSNSTFVQWVSSRDEITAKEFITDYVAHWAREANRAARRVAEGWEGVVGLDGSIVEVVDEKRGITAMVVKFKNGARIYSLSSNPLAFAGKGGDVLIDEWDLHENQAAIYDMAYPCITWGGQLELVSAYDPEGSEDTEFAKLCLACKNGEKPNISFHRTTIMDAIDDGFVETVNEVKAAKGRATQTREEFLISLRDGCRTTGAFDSQYMCIPNKAHGEQLIKSSDLSASRRKIDILRIHCEGMGELESRPDLKDKTFWAELFGKVRHELGWDIAVTGDLSSIFVNRRDGDIRRLFALITLHQCDRITSQREIVAAMLEASYEVVGAGDKSGLGRSDCTELELQFPDRFVGVVFGQQSKLMLGVTAQSVYEQGRQLLPVDYPEISKDVSCVKTSSTIGGKLSFVETRNELLPESHCDIFWSNALALHAGETIDNLGPCAMEPSKRPDRLSLDEPQDNLEFNGRDDLASYQSVNRFGGY